MSTIGKAQIEVSVDADGVEVGVGQAKRSLKSLADTAAESGARGRKGVAEIGEGGDAAAKKIEQSTRSLISSIQRTTAAMEAGSRSGAEYFRVLASQRGVDQNVLRPYLEQLEAARARQEALSASAASTAPNLRALAATMSGVSPAASAAAASLDRVGLSARATAAAMRGVPAQFTDIITSLQGGQAPLTVLLQQGGQLKDMFGGIGPAARALGGYIAGLITPLTVAAAAVTALGVAYLKGSEEASAYSNALVLTGNAAATTVGSLQDMAVRISATTGATVGASAEALAALAGSGRIAAEGFERFAEVAIKSLKLLDTPIAETIKQLEELGKSPVAASVKLNESTNYLTESIYKQIKALEDQGFKTQAAQVAQEAWANATVARLAQVEGNLGSLQRGWNNLVGAAKSAWDAMLGVGRSASPSEALAAVESKIRTAQEAAAQQARTPTLQGWWASRGASPGALADLEAQKSTLQEINRLSGAKAAFDQAAAVRVKALAEYDAQHLKYLTKAEQAEKEILATRKLMVAAGKSEKEIASEIALIRDKYKESPAKSGSGRVANVSAEVSEYKKLTESLEKYNAQLTEELAGESKLTASQKIGIEVRRKLSAAHREALGALLEKARGMEIALEMQKFMREAEDDARKSEQARAEALRTSAKAVIEDAARIREHTAELGLSKSAIDEVKAARDADTLAVQRSELALLDATGQCTAYSEALRDSVAALTDRASALKEDAIAQASADAAKKAEADWKRTSDQIEQSLTDALLRGFESGKDFATNLRDTVINLFKTMVLRPVIQATVTGGLESIGLGGSTTAGASAQSAVGALQQANSLSSGITNIFNVGSMVAGGYGALPGTLAASNAVGAFGGDSLGALITLNPQWTAAAASVTEVAGATAAAAEGAAAAAVAAEGAAAGATAAAGAAAAVPYVGWVVAAAAALYSIFGSDGPGKSQGAAAYTSLSQGKIGPTDIGEGPADKYASGYQAPLNSINASFLGAIDALGNALGKQQEVILTSAIKARGDGKQYGGLGVSINGSAQQDFAWAYEEGDQQATAKLAAQALSTVLVTAIQSSTFSDQIKSLFDGLVTPESTLNMVQSIVALTKVSEQLNATWGLTIDQAAGVAKLTADGTEQGRVAAVAAVAQAALLQKAVSASLSELFESIEAPFKEVIGESLPATLKGYDDALKSIDKTAQSGIEKFAYLFSLRGNFASFLAAVDGLKNGINTAVEDFRTPEDRISRRQAALSTAVAEAGITLPDSYAALVSLADGIDYTTEAGLHLALTLPAVVTAFRQLQDVAGPVAQRIADERSGLQEQLDGLTLTSTQLLSRQRDALDASNRALFDQVQAATEAKRVAEERMGWQEQLDALMLTSTQLLERQRAALDASNRALFDQVQAAAEAKRVAEERSGLQEQLDALTLTSTQLLERQRAALDASNRALFDQVQAATEAKRVAEERRGLQDQIDQALGDTAALRQRELDALDPSNRALKLRIYALADEKAASEAAKAESERAAAELKSAYDNRLSDARSKLQAAYSAESAAINGVIEKMGGFAQAARALMADLYAGDESPLSSAQKFDRAKSGLAGVITRANAADQSALGELQGYLALSKENSATFVDYARDFATVVGTLGAAADTASEQERLAKYQLAELKKQVDGLLQVDASVLTVADAIAELNAVTAGGLLGVVNAVASSASLTAAAIASASASSASATTGHFNLQTAAGQASQLAYENASWSAASDAAARAYGDAITAINEAMLSEHYGARRVDDAYRAEIFRSYGVPGYASGGDFAGGLRLVGERGPELEVTGPSRLYSAHQTSDLLGGWVAEIRMLRSLLELLRAEIRATASHTGRTAKILDRVMPDGDALAVRIAT